MPTRTFNIFSEKVVVYAGETFDWTVSSDAVAPNDISLGSQTWTLDPDSFTFESGGPLTQSATVEAPAEAPDSYIFACNPPAPNIVSQSLVIARQYVTNLCNDVFVMPGDHFIWHNLASQGVSIAPAEGQAEFWPFSEESFDLAPGHWVAVHVPDGATEAECTLEITYADGTTPCDVLATQPKLNVGGGVGGSARRDSRDKRPER
jgi:hypothetical protein